LRGGGGDDGAMALPQFLECLVTPKLTFSLKREPHWTLASEIEQSKLRQAFLTRFSLPIDCSSLNFLVVGSPQLTAETTKLVFKIRCDDADEERVLLRILGEVEKAFEDK
jgi:hypothetical protein